MIWQEALLKAAKSAYRTGKKLEFTVIKRPNRRKWRIFLTKLEEHGEDDVDDED